MFVVCRRIVAIGDDVIYATLNNISSDPEFKGASSIPILIISYLNHLSDLKNLRDCRILYSKEVFMLIPVVIYARQDFFLINEINKKMDFMQSAGLIQFWHVDYEKRNRGDLKERPKVLTINHLSGSFQILFFGSLVSLLVFMSEFLFFLAYKHVRK